MIYIRTPYCWPFCFSFFPLENLSVYRIFPLFKLFSRGECLERTTDLVGGPMSYARFCPYLSRLCSAPL